MYLAAINPTATERVVTLSSSIPLPITTVSNDGNRCQTSPSHVEASSSNLNRVVGRVSLHQIPMPTNFLSAPANKFEASTSRAPMSNRNDEPIISSSSYFVEEPRYEDRIFRQNIRAYNHVFSFTSMGVALDENLPAFNQGIYTFRAHGLIYHRIGTLLPPPGMRPRYLQMFIYDTDNELEHRLQESGGLDPELIEKIRHLLDAHNPFVKIFRQLAQHADIHDCRLLIREKPGTNLQYTLPTSSQVAAILVGGKELMEGSDRDIIVQTVGGELINIKDYAGYYDPLQYPLLLPYGTYGWYSNYESVRGRRITCCDYYAYMLQIEAQKLRWIRFHQNDIRAELYEGLQDCLNAGENNAGNVGRRIIFPSSFTGSPRDMYKRYQDAMAIVQKFGKPDIFLTMTCNPTWKEIEDQLLPGQTPQDRPDLLTQILKAKYEELKEDIFHKGVLGKR
ncbi:hypothetical protein Sango_0021700 [Sesamum angolense]|uniref:Helitron helicase-like domain-containing protein n=1 Tax=Sesamum angolense TaxID=2727404 RepID=A0AAE2C546_9LAMI|nr:hypothetical protein Sango_0021700 [Sesamum angolense]